MLLKPPEAHMFVRRLIIGLIWNSAIFGGLLFGLAGTLDWWRAWVFLGVVLAWTVTTMAILFPTGREDLLEERMKSPIQKGQPFADKIIIVLLIAAFVGVIALIPLDVFRFHLLAKPGVIVSSLGLILFAAGWLIISLTYKENTFAIAVVRYQQERGQTVIDTGVYSIVRHPMYAGATILLVGMPLWLESYAGALLAAIPIGIIIVRILVEERLLRSELKGYEEYTHRVRYRLIPYLW